MVWLVRKAPDRIRPSEINGCPVQQISYLDEIDDETVLEALEKLRGRSQAVHVGSFVTSKPPRNPKQTSTQSMNATNNMHKTEVHRNPSAHKSPVAPLKHPSLSTVKGIHRSFDSRKNRQAPKAAPISPDSSVASSVVSSGAAKPPAAQPKKLMWAWLGRSLSDINCGSFPMAAENTSKATAAAAAEKMKRLGVIFRNENGELRQKRLIALNKALSQHLVKRCSGGGVDKEGGDLADDEETLDSATVQTLDSATALTDPTEREEVSLEDSDKVKKQRWQKTPSNNEHDMDGSPQTARRSDLKTEIARFLDATAKLLVEGGFGDNDTVTLYTYDDTDVIHSGEDEDDGTLDEGTLDDGTMDDGTMDDGTMDDGTMDDGTMDETFYTLDTGSFDETLTLTINEEEAPHDEIHQDMRINSKSLLDDSNIQVAKLGQVTFASGDSEEGFFSRNVAQVAAFKEEGQEVNQNGVPEKLVVVGYDPPEDCSLLSESSPLYIHAVSKTGKLIE
jgi:hypothetical protein